MVARMPDVEILYLLDNRRRTVGAKRNALLDMAAGDYVSFIDDDDDVAADYVRRIYSTIVKTRKSPQQADVICFRQLAHLVPHNVIHDCSYSLEHYRNRKPEERRQLAPAVGEDGKPLPNVLLWSGPPAHTMAWRREIVKDIRFPERQFGEDVSWVDLACERASSEIQLGGEPAYNYRFDAAKTATR
jgi:glycosyltransferase involved in cell wall biosynthesis